MNEDLYLAHELGAALIAPWQETWRNSLRMCGSLAAALPSSARHACAAWELLAALQASGERPPFGQLGDDVQEDVVIRLPFCSLRRFHRGSGAPRVLLVAPLSGHCASRLRDTVRVLLQDHEVFVTDWHNARDVPLAAGSFDFDEYVAYLLGFVRLMGQGAHLVAICQACIPALAATALLAEDADQATPASLALLCGPVDPRINPTAIGAGAAAMPPEWFEHCMTTVVPAGFVGAGRRVAPGFLQVPNLSWAESCSRLCGLLQSCAGLRVMNPQQIEAARQGYQDELATLDLSAEFYVSAIERVFRQAALPRGRLEWRGRLVRPGAIRDTRLMTVEGENDDVCGLGQTHAAHDLCSGLPSGMRSRMTQPLTGHVSLFSGPAWRDQVYPGLRAMIEMSERCVRTRAPERRAGLHV